MHLKGGRTIKDLIVKPKDRDTIWQKSRVIYRYTHVAEWIVKKNILRSQAEHLQKDTKNT